MLEVKNLTKKYANKTAVDQLSFSMKSGQVVGFLGPNGAGKTTTMKMICGYMAPSSGDVFIDGQLLLDHPIESKKKIGYLPENTPLYTDMRVEDYLSYVCQLKGYHGPQVKELVKEALSLCHLNDVKHKIIDHLSKGYRQRLGLAQAIVHQPKLIVLDEPTIGLDPKQVSEMRNLLKSLARDRTILISSHILSEIQTICDNVLVLNEGKLLANKSMAEIKQEMEREEVYFIETASTQLSSDSLVAAFSYIKSISKKDKGYEILFEDKPQSINEVLNFFIQNKIEITSFYKKEVSLEDVYLKITEANQ